MIENASRVGCVVFDKTGTLTKGELEVREIACCCCCCSDDDRDDCRSSPAPETRSSSATLTQAGDLAAGGEEDDEAMRQGRLLAIAASAEKGSEHPIGQAIVRAAKERHLQIAEPTDFVAAPGDGLSCRVRWQSRQTRTRCVTTQLSDGLSALKCDSQKLAI